MGKRETNRVRMLGVLPSYGADPIPVGKIPDEGTQVLKSGDAENETAILYTVTAGKILYLSSLVFSLTFGADVSGHCRVAIRDEDDLNPVDIINVTHRTYNGAGIPCSFCPPIEIPALWDIFLVSSIADLFVQCFIHGYEA